MALSKKKEIENNLIEATNVVTLIYLLVGPTWGFCRRGWAVLVVVVNGGVGDNVVQTRLGGVGFLETSPPRGLLAGLGRGRRVPGE